MAKIEPEIEDTQPEERRCEQGWLESYLDLTEEQEAKEIYHLWTGISVISNTLGRKCFINRGHYFCYPNQYIILIGDSGSRKSTAANYGVALYKEAELKHLFKGKITMRALSKRLHKTYEVDKHSSVYLYSPELHKMLGSDSYTSGLMTFLTDFYDCPDYDEYETATQGCDSYQNVFINLLGATVPNWLGEMPKTMIEGGFSGRSIFVVEEGPRKHIAFPEAGDYQTRENLSHDLIQISKLRGEFQLTPVARKLYKHWYEEVHAKNKDFDVRLKSYYSRKGEHVFKLAMALNSSRSNSMMIDERDLEQAMVFLQQIELKMPDAFSSVSLSEDTRHSEMVRSVIKKAGGEMEHGKILKKMWYHAKANTVKEILYGMEEQGMAKQEIRGGKRYWILTDEGV